MFAIMMIDTVTGFRRGFLQGGFETRERAENAVAKLPQDFNYVVSGH